MSAPGGGLSSPQVPLRLPGAWRLVVGREDGREPWEPWAAGARQEQPRTAREPGGGGAKQPPEGSSTLNHFKTRSPLRSGQASGYESRKAQQARSTRAQSTSWTEPPPAIKRTFRHNPTLAEQPANHRSSSDKIPLYSPTSPLPTSLCHSSSGLKALQAP
jgi:hypothetical protein